MSSSEPQTESDLADERSVGFKLAVLTSGVHLLLNYGVFIPENWASAIHFTLLGSLAALIYFRSKGLQVAVPSILLSSTIYLVLFEDALYGRGQQPIPSDYLAALSAMVVGLFLTARAIGWFIPILIVVFFSYAVYWGKLLSGVFHFPGLSMGSMVVRIYFGPDGMFGSIAQLSWSSVYMFVLFGAFLQVSGAGDSLIGVASRLSSRFTGGTGLVAVIASGFMGSISGSAIANTAATGVITIPGMRRVGYQPEHAAGIEAAASTGGQLMPPIMGAGAFVMASFTQLPYQRIIGAALLPAILYYLSLAFYVRAHAIRNGIDSSGSGDIRSNDRNGWRHLVSLGVLVIALVAGYSPLIAVGWAIGSVVALSWTSNQPMGLQKVLRSLALGARGMVVTGLLLVVIGILVNVITTTGLGNTFSFMAVRWSSGNLLVLLLLVALASLVLGAGLPVTASYIVVATLVASVLSELISAGLAERVIAEGRAPVSLDALRSILPNLGEDGSSLGRALREAPSEVRGLVTSMVLPASRLSAAVLSAHLIIFWLSQDSNVTPPVCLVAYTAAGIASASPAKTGFVAWRFAKALYIVPLLMAYTSLVVGDLSERLLAFFFAAIGLFLIVAAFQGVLVRTIPPWVRGGCLILGVATMWPSSSLVPQLVSISIFALLVFAPKRFIG